MGTLPHVMQPDWYQRAVIYQVDPAAFHDSNGDGWGDLRGIAERMDYLRGIGANTLWLMPFYPSPFKDWGYDISDFLGVDPRFGDVADMAHLLSEAEDRGIHVITELVMQHTSDQHPWFQEARRDRQSPYRDYYVWADEPHDTVVTPAFPTVKDTVWTWDEEAGQYFRHMFYDHMPDLNLTNPRVIQEIERVMHFWLRLGVTGFRIDAAQAMVQEAARREGAQDGFWLLEHLRTVATQRRPNAVLLGEVPSDPKEYPEYFGEGDRINLLLNFWGNNHTFLSLARQDSTAIRTALDQDPEPPRTAQYATWLRNHDELSLHLLKEEDADEVLEVFAPDPEMQAYGRGIRRRLAPMLDGDPDRILMAHALLFSLPGTPVIRYGDEIGMGDDLDLEERHAVRTPMQWSSEDGGGFSSAPPSQYFAPMITDGDYGFKKINVYDQTLEDHSVLSRISKMMRARMSLNEVGAGRCQPLDVGDDRVLVIRYDLNRATAIMAVNLCDEEVSFDLPGDDLGDLVDLLADAPYEHFSSTAPELPLHPHGYRWLRRLSTLVD